MPRPAVLDHCLSTPVTYADVLMALYDARYSGPITFHFHHGVPIVVDAPPADPPLKIRLTLVEHPVQAAASA